MASEVVVIGSSGHASVVIELLEQLKYTIVGCIDSFAPKGKKILDYTVLGNETLLNDVSILGTNQVVIAIGNNFHRNEFYQKINKINPELIYPTIISPFAKVSSSSKIGQGTIIMEQVVIHANSIIGDFNILNTNSLIEHDCLIENFSSVSPGAVLCGNVKLSNLSFVGASSTIIQKVQISNNTIIGAGAIVTKDCDPFSLYLGVPAKKITGNYSNTKYI